MKRFTPILILCAFVLGSFSRSEAQSAVAPYKFDLGLSLGMSGYIGDTNSSNPFSHPGFTADFRGGYIIDSRWQIRAQLSTLGLSGDTKKMANVLPGGEEFKFTSQVVDLCVRGEFNFFSYGIGETYKRLRRWSPYLAVGVGFSMAFADGHTACAPSIPMAFGIRFKPRERINFHAEFSMTKSFTDHLDGKEIADLNHIKTDFYKNTDWFSRIIVGVTYEFGKRCETCHYVD